MANGVRYVRVMFQPNVCLFAAPISWIILSLGVCVV